MSPPAADLASVAGRLGALLRAAGMNVTPERSGRLVASMSLAMPVYLDELYWLARVTLVAERDDVEIFDRVFAQVFGGMVDPADWRGQASSTSESTERAPARRSGPRREPAAGTLRGDMPWPMLLGGDGGSGGPEREMDGAVAAMSPEEHLRHKDFAAFTDEEIGRLREIGAQLAEGLETRRGRRFETHRLGADLDLRATLRRSPRTGGEPLAAAYRRRRRRPRRLVLICDISGSMEAYSRAYLQLLIAAAQRGRAEIFVFATRLTRLTRTMRGSGAGGALERAGRAAPDWHGGTRIGEALKAFNDGFGRRGLARGAVVVVLSDGWETGDAEELARQMERLSRLAFRVVWANPRAAGEGFAPFAGGMAAALPFVDRLVSGHSVAAVAEACGAVRRGRNSGMLGR